MTMHISVRPTLTALSLALCGCAAAPAAPEIAVSPAPAPSLANFFEQYDQSLLALRPESKASRGIRDGDYGRWGDASLAGDEAQRRLRLDALARMRAGFDSATLTGQEALSYRLFEADVARSESLVPFREYGYLFDQMNGQQSGIPAFLINTHTVQNAAHAEAYVQRIAGIGALMDQHLARSAARAAGGVLPPRWVYSYVLSDIDNLLAAGNDNAVLEDFRSEVAALDLPDAERARLITDAEAAWQASAVPAYQRLRAEMVRQQAMAGTDDGVWRFPNGAAYYDALLEYYTTTDLTAEQIHALGLSETERIHGEMRAIMARVGFEGTLQEFFEYTRTDPRFYYTTREEYLADVSSALDRMTARLPDYFLTLPQFPLEVKPVEAFREQSAGKAFYSSPAPDGSRPGRYYVNLYNLADMSRNELEALAFHEGVPGHHLQRAIQTGLGDLPPFRRFGGYTAYTEGWGLYSEELAKDMGFYTDPYSDFGRLGMELWRAGRLVVDTGIHDQRWTREQAIQWLTENTPNPPGDIEKAIERYIVYPGQATAYTIGKLKIMELRQRARTALGEDFDIREFHEQVLSEGPVPLDVLDERVNLWIEAQR